MMTTSLTFCRGFPSSRRFLCDEFELAVNRRQSRDYSPMTSSQDIRPVSLTLKLMIYCVWVQLYIFVLQSWHKSVKICLFVVSLHVSSSRSVCYFRHMFTVLFVVWWISCISFSPEQKVKCLGIVNYGLGTEHDWIFPTHWTLIDRWPPFRGVHSLLNNDQSRTQSRVFLWP